MNVSHDSRPLILIVDDTPANLGVLVDLLSCARLRGLGRRGRRQRAGADRVRGARSDSARRADAQPGRLRYVRATEGAPRYARYSGHLHDRPDRYRQQGERLRARCRRLHHQAVPARRGDCAHHHAPHAAAAQTAPAGKRGAAVARHRVGHGRDRHARPGRAHHLLQSRRRARVSVLVERSDRPALRALSCPRLCVG